MHKHKHFDELVNHPLKWEKYKGIQILQPPIVQCKGGCAFTALARQLEYNLRIQYAGAAVPTSLPEPESFVDYKKWQSDLEQTNNGKRRWQPQQILENAKQNGVPLFNGGRHSIQEVKSVYRRANKNREESSVPLLQEADKMAKLKDMLRFFPVVGVMTVNEKYSQYGCDVYEGEGRFEKEGYYNHDGIWVTKNATHAVVVLDWKICGGRTYFAYQDSHGNPHLSMCGRSIAWMESDKLIEFHYGRARLPVHPSLPFQSLEDRKAFNQKLENEFRHISSEIKMIPKIRVMIEDLIVQCKNSYKLGKTQEVKDLCTESRKCVDRVKKLMSQMQIFIEKHSGLGTAVSLNISDIEKKVGEISGRVKDVSDCVCQLSETHNKHFKAYSIHCRDDHEAGPSAKKERI